MDITIVLAVYNKIELTKEFYKLVRDLYPHEPIVISSAGSTDGTNEWLKSLNDDNLKFSIIKNRVSHSENHNNAISLVETSKLVIVHNDMIIGKYFLENLDKLITEDTLLSYLTIEPPIYGLHLRAGKKIMDLGDSFENFNHDLFNQYVDKHKDKCEIYDGAVFFMSGYKKMFEDIGGFDGETFYPAFCEDDDLLIRAKLKGYKLKTTECAITYHFVSKTSRDNNKDEKDKIEINSNRNFVRKWGMPIFMFVNMKYWSINDFNYNRFTIGLKKLNNVNLYDIEPFFDKITIDDYDVEDYIISEQKNTNYDLSKKFGYVDDCDVVITETLPFDETDYSTIFQLRFLLPQYDVGTYQINRLIIKINKKLS